MIKKSRVSRQIRRTILRHETRVLQLLKGHPAIPYVVGYHRIDRFEYIGLELLGQELKTMVQPGHTLRPVTVARVGEQLHLYAHKIIHRGTGPNNILLFLSDPSRARLIDFGLARYLVDVDSTLKTPYTPNKDGRLVGTVTWCSLNAHDGLDLRPCDDLESAAYTLFFLALGNLHWREYPCDQTRISMARIATAKRQFTSVVPVSDLPTELSDVLQIARATPTNYKHALSELRQALGYLAASYDQSDGSPLNWDPITPPWPIPQPPHPHAEANSNDTGSCDYTYEANEEYTDSYFDWDIGEWELQCGQDLSFTFPSGQGELLDGQIPSCNILEPWSDPF